MKKQIETEGPGIPFPSLEIGEDPQGAKIVVRVGRYGPYIQRGEGGKENIASVPEELAPAELTLEKALDILDHRARGPAAIGVDPSSGQCVFFKKGRFGNYLEVALTEAEEKADAKPRRVTLPEGVKPEDLSEEEMQGLLALPKQLGLKEGEPVLASIGQYGAYVKCGTETRNVASWRDAVALDLAAALALLAQPKIRRGRTADPATPVEAIKEFGKLEGTAGPVRVLPGRYGPYVTDGKTNATLPKGMSPEDVTAEQAVELIKARAAAGPPAKRRFVKRK